MGWCGDSSAFSGLDSCSNDNHRLENYTCSAHAHVAGQTKKCIESKQELIFFVFAHLCGTLGEEKRATLQVPLDSGASGGTMVKTHASELRHEKVTPTEWSVTVGSFTTNKKMNVNFQLPELSTMLTFNVWPMCTMAL